MIGNLKFIQYGDTSYHEGTFFSTLFDSDMTISIDKGVPLEYAEKCIDNFNSLPSCVLNDLYDKCIEYYEDTLFNIDDDCDLDFDMPQSESIHGRDILKYISVGTLEIEKPQGNSIAYILELNCVWEEEHGCEWVIKDNQVLYVGKFYYTSPFELED